MTKRKKNQSITDTIAQHLETTDSETVVVSEEKLQPVTPKEVVKEAKKEEKKVVKTVKENVITSPHHKDSATSAINFGINSIL